MDTYKRIPISIDKGKGCWVWDIQGRKYLDAVAGIATCTLGHSDPVLFSSLKKQLKKIQHVSNLYQIPEQEELADWLVRHSCADKVFFCNSGAEANESAIKLSRKFSHLYKKIETPIILSAKNSFHGRTLAALSATGQKNYQDGFEPLFDGFHFFEYNNINSFKQTISLFSENLNSIASVLIEPLQGEGGVNLGDQKFFAELREICTKREILLIFDEVQTGMGRCGTLWGYEQLGIEPDAFTLAKGLGGGHPIGALLVKENANFFKQGDHASTFGGNPFACKASLTVAKEIIRRNLLKNVRSRGEQLNKGLSIIQSKFSEHFKEVRGVGLIQGLVINQYSNLSAKDIVESSLDQSLLVVAAGQNVVRIVPPLTISSSEIKEILIRLEFAIKLCL